MTHTPLSIYWVYNGTRLLIYHNLYRTTVCNCITDPFGFLSPITIQAKMHMQDLWRSGIDWDEPLNQEHIKTYMKPPPSNSQDTTLIQNVINPWTYTHSLKAYNAVALLRNGKQIQFIMTRSSVVPLKGHTLP